MTRASTAASSRFYTVFAELYQTRTQLFHFSGCLLSQLAVCSAIPPRCPSKTLRSHPVKGEAPLPPGVQPQPGVHPSSSQRRGRAAPPCHHPHPTPARQRPQPHALPLSTGGAARAAPPGPNAEAAGETSSFPLPCTLSHADPLTASHQPPFALPQHRLTPAENAPARCTDGSPPSQVGAAGSFRTT